MPAEPIYLPPQDYSVIWPLLGGFILLGLLIWVACIWLLTRKPEEANNAPLPPAAIARLRQDALTRIDAVEQAVRQGEMRARKGHHELSTVVRGFVSKASGLEADTMTAADLRSHGPAHLAMLIEQFYPQQFGIDEADPPSIARSAQAARDVVGGWVG